MTYDADSHRASVFHLNAPDEPGHYVISTEMNHLGPDVDGLHLRKTGQKIVVGEGTPVMSHERFAFGLRPPTYWELLDPTGKQLAWADDGGNVYVANLTTIQKELRRIGLE